MWLCAGAGESSFRPPRVSVMADGARRFRCASRCRSDHSTLRGVSRQFVSRRACLKGTPGIIMRRPAPVCGGRDLSNTCKDFPFPGRVRVGPRRATPRSEGYGTGSPRLSAPVCGRRDLSHIQARARGAFEGFCGVPSVARLPGAHAACAPSARSGSRRPWRAGCRAPGRNSSEQRAPGRFSRLRRAPWRLSRLSARRQQRAAGHWCWLWSRSTFVSFLWVSLQAASLHGCCPVLAAFLSPGSSAVSRLRLEACPDAREAAAAASVRRHSLSAAHVPRSTQCMAMTSSVPSASISHRAKSPALPRPSVLFSAPSRNGRSLASDLKLLLLALHACRNLLAPLLGLSRVPWRRSGRVEASANVRRTPGSCGIRDEHIYGASCPAPCLPPGM